MAPVRHSPGGLPPPLVPMIITSQTAHTPEPPAEIVSRLRQIDPRLGLHFAASYDSAPYWAFKMDWAADDPKRKRVIAGEIPPEYAFDMIGMLPLDCTVDQAYGFAVNSLRRAGTDYANEMLDRVKAYNNDLNKTIWAGSTDEANNMIEVMSHKLFAEQGKTIPKSYGGIAAKPRAARNKKR